MMPREALFRDFAMRWPIRYQILVPFAAAMLTGLVSVSALSALLAARRAERQIDEQVRNLGRTLVESTFPLTDTVLEQMRGLSGAEFILFDTSGKVAARSKTAPAHSAGRLPGRPWQQLALGPLIEAGGNGFFLSSLAMPPRGPATHALTLDILYPEQHWRASRREAALPPLLVGAATLAAFMVVAAVIAVRLGRPIARLRAQVARLAEGDFQTLPLPQRNDELRDLARGVNVLAEQLTQMRRAIGRAERFTVLGQLSGGLAHHLRNDITGARMAVQLHQRHGCHADEESLDVALRQLQLTEEHLQQFLSAGQPRPLQKTRCDPWPIIEHVAKMIEPTCRHRKVDLRTTDERRDSPLIDNEGQGCVEADPEQLRQLLMNLALNAVEAAGPGGWLRIELAASRQEVLLRVFDGGPGIAAEIAERLFEPFATAKPEGIGLGLAVARQIAQAHGGTLDYRRQTGVTCFELRLPRHDFGFSILDFGLNQQPKPDAEQSKIQNPKSKIAP